MRPVNDFLNGILRVAAIHAGTFRRPSRAACTDQGPEAHASLQSVFRQPRTPIMDVSESQELGAEVRRLQQAPSIGLVSNIHLQGRTEINYD